MLTSLGDLKWESTGDITESEKMVIQRGKIWRIRRVRENFSVQVGDNFQGCFYRVRGRASWNRIQRPVFWILSSSCTFRNRLLAHRKCIYKLWLSLTRIFFQKLFQFFVFNIFRLFKEFFIPKIEITVPKLLKPLFT